MVQRDSKRALEERLEASSVDYRAMKKRLFEASFLLVAVGALHILLALFFYFSSPDDPDPATQRSLEMAAVLSCVIGLATLACASLLPRHPRAITTSVLLVWVLIQLMLIAISPLNLLHGALLKLAMVIVLLRGVLAARDAEATRARLRAEAIAGR